MIPKIIHYCWFGGNDKSIELIKSIQSWKKVLNDYKLIEWNESNFDVNNLLFTRENYKRKKYAFVSDVARLDALYEYGGIYLDTDVIVKKSFNPFLNHKLFLGMMFDDSIGTAVIASEKNNRVIYNLRKLYENMDVTNTPNNDIFTKYFIDNYNEFILGNIYQVLNDSTIIYPKEYFERPTYNKNKGYSIHKNLGSWHDGIQNNNIVRYVLKRILGPVLISKIQNFRIIKKAAYYDVYLEHKKIRKKL